MYIIYKIIIIFLIYTKHGYQYNETWLSVYETDALNDIYNNFIQILLRYYNMSFSLKYITSQKL